LNCRSNALHLWKLVCNIWHHVLKGVRWLLAMGSVLDFGWIVRLVDWKPIWLIFLMNDVMWKWELCPAWIWEVPTIMLKNCMGVGIGCLIGTFLLNLAFLIFNSRLQELLILYIMVLFGLLFPVSSSSFFFFGL